MKQIKNFKKTKNNNHYLAYLNTGLTDYEKIINIDIKGLHRSIASEFISKGLAIFKVEKKKFSKKRNYTILYNYTIYDWRDEITSGDNCIREINYKAFDSFLFHYLLSEGTLFELKDEEVIFQIALENI